MNWLLLNVMTLLKFELFKGIEGPFRCGAAAVFVLVYVERAVMLCMASGKQGESIFGAGPSQKQ